jgi:2-methylisocitrate lyase-like PEP mutase family enzyme
MSGKAALLRQLLAAGEMVVAPGCHDPFTARIIEEIGFKAVYLGGFATGAHLVHTAPLVEMTEQAQVASMVNKVIEAPLVVDADAGWGDVLQTIRTVREFEHAGVAGFHFEDHVQPKPMSYYKNLQVDVIPRAEFLDKIRLVLSARRDPDTVVIGRTDAFSAQNGSKEEAVERGAEMLEAGVDLVFFSGAEAPEDTAFIRRALPEAPLFTIALGDRPLDYYRDAGFRMVIFPTGSVAATHRAVTQAYTSLFERGVLGYAEGEYRDRWRRVLETLRIPKMWDLEESGRLD